MNNRHNFVRVAAFGTALPSLLLSAHQPERIVKDQVQTRPVRDQYADLLKASARLNAGQSVLVADQPQQQPVAV